MAVDSIKGSTNLSIPKDQEESHLSPEADSRSASSEELGYQSSFDHGHGSIADAVSGFDVGKRSEIDQTPINRALRGTPIENPIRIAGGTTILHPNLADSGVEEEAGPSSKGKETQKAANRLSSLLRTGSLIANAKGSKSSGGRPSDPVQDDMYRRQREMNNRERALEEMQSSPEEKEKLRVLRGINRKDE